MAKKKTLGDLLMQSLEDAVAFDNGRLEARTRTVEVTARDARVDEPPRYTSSRIRAVREKLALSQQVFARALNVSPQTVRAWEQGSRVPDGPTRRLLEIAEESPEILTRKVHPLRGVQN